MKVIDEEDVDFICNVIDGVEDRLDDVDKKNIITLLRGHLREIDTLTPKETDLVLAAEKYAELYDGDDRQDIKTDVLNAFYNGAYFNFEKVMQGDALTVSKLRPMCDAPKDGSVFLAKHDFDDDLRETWSNGDDFAASQCFNTQDCSGLISEDFEGWIPKPIYKPELA